MYFYLYDSFLNNKKYITLLTRIEHRLIDLGINGKIEKMNVLKNLQEVIDDAIENGADTVIAVGNDKTFTKVISAVAKQNGITFGFIPVENSLIAKILGIPSGEKACDILSARIIEKIDLGKINQRYFFSMVEAAGSPSLVLEDNGCNYKISSLNQNNLIQICNLAFPYLSKDIKGSKRCNPKDGQLEVVFTPVRSTIFGKNQLDYDKRSIFPIKKIKIQSEDPVSLVTDGEAVVKTPVTIEVIPRKLKIIVGKGREF